MKSKEQRRREFLARKPDYFFKGEKVKRSRAKEFIELMEQGMSVLEIADRCSITDTTVRVYLKDYYPERYSKLKRKNNRKLPQNVIELYEEGHTLYSIADKYNVSREAVRQNIVRNNETDRYEAEKKRRKEERLKKGVKQRLCNHCNGLVPPTTNNYTKKYCSDECRIKHQGPRRVIKYPEWVGNRSINQRNFTKDEWREINRIRGNYGWKVHHKKRLRSVRRWQSSNRDKISVYAKRYYEKKVYGKTITPLPSKSVDK